MMADFKQECKLCDYIISDKNFKVIEDVAKDIFDFLLLKPTLIGTQNVICTTCYSKLIAALNFKTKCLYTDNTIIPYVDFNNSKPDLKQIYAKEKGSKQGDRSLDDRDVCRLCLEPVSGNHKSIQEVPVGCIEIYIPEINFEATTNPIICIKCYDALLVHSTFIKNWADVGKRSGDAKNCGEIFLNDQCIKREEIEFKSEETDADMLSETLCDINKEELDERDTALQSQIDLKHTTESKSLYDLDDREQTSAQTSFVNNDSEECSFETTSESRNSKNFMQHQIIHKDPSEVQMYKCDECTYRSIRKGNLKRHQLTHKDPAEVEMFKCDKCTFETIHKNSFITHCLTHKDPSEVRMFKCDECDYKSKLKGNLLQHQRTHKDSLKVKMLKCDKCVYETKHKNNLIRHCLTHKAPPK